MYEFKKGNVELLEPVESPGTDQADLLPGQWPVPDCLGLFECTCNQCEHWLPDRGRAFLTLAIGPNGVEPIRADYYCQFGINSGDRPPDQLHYCKLFEPFTEDLAG